MGNTDGLFNMFVGVFVVGMVLFQVFTGKIVELDAVASTTNASVGTAVGVFVRIGVGLFMGGLVVMIYWSMSKRDSDLNESTGALLIREYNDFFFTTACCIDG